MQAVRPGLLAAALLTLATASAAVTGVVVDEHGNPLPGADVWLTGGFLPGENSSTIGHVTSDASAILHMRGNAHRA